MIAPMRRLTPLLFVAATATLAAACAEVGSPGGAAQLSVDSLSASAVLLNDVLRDSAGTPVALTAHAFDIEGDELPDAPVRYGLTSTASGITIDSVTGEISAPMTRFTGATRQTGVFARVGGLQTPPFTVTVVREPSAVRDDTAARVTDDITTAFRQATLTATVVGDTSVEGTATAPPGPVPGVWVRFEPASVPASLVDSVVLVGDFTMTPTRYRSWSRTSASGVATQLVRVYFAPGGPAATADTLDFRAILLVRGQPVDTASILLPILTRPATP